MQETGGGLMENIFPNNSKLSSYHGLYDMELYKVLSIAKNKSNNIWNNTLKPRS